MKVKFIPQNVEIEIDPNKSVMRLAHENNLPVKSVCNGLPSCAECRVVVEEGEHNVLPPTSEELDLIGTGYFVDRRRLACQMKCFGDVVVDLSEQVEKEKLNSTRRPQGFIKKDISEESLAVTGNLIDADAALLSDKETDINEKDVSEDEDALVLKSNNKNSNKKPRNKKKQRSNNNNRSKGSAQKKSASSSENNKPSEGKANKKRRPRNRNRNCHKKNTSSDS